MPPLAKDPNFLIFLAMRCVTTIALQVISVVVAWQVYDKTHNPLYLGYVGLAIFLPNMLLALPGGRLADILPRQRVMLVSLLLFMLCSLALLTASQSAQSMLPLTYATLVIFGMTKALGNPATAAFLPQMVGAERLTRAVAINSGLFQAATIIGPSAAGILYTVSGGNLRLIYGLCAFMLFVGCILTHLLPRLGVPHVAAADGRRLLGGLKFVWHKKVILGAVSLDLFAVLLGGATALLPVFARDILGVGAAGLGLMRSAPALGALLMASLLAFRPLRSQVGVKMLFAVALFGMATVVFALSRSFMLSLVCLAALGAFDMVSVVVRQTLIQLNTPDAMRGRVNAVSMVFIGASNELGEFESGLTAALWGTVPAVLAGGVGTIIVVLLCALLFPALRRADRFVSVPSSKEDNLVGPSAQTV